MWEQIFGIIVFDLPLPLPTRVFRHTLPNPYVPWGGLNILVLWASKLREKKILHYVLFISRPTLTVMGRNKLDPEHGQSHAGNHQETAPGVVQKLPAFTQHTFIAGICMNVTAMSQLLLSLFPWL